MFFRSQSSSPKERTPPPGSKPTGGILQRSVVAEDEQLSRVKESSEISEIKDQAPR